MLVSVIIPVYNRAFELKRAINSVLNQTEQDFEILVVDDCSTVNILEIINMFDDKRIKYFRFDKKGNANVCRNIGIVNSIGLYIAMLDSDDEWLPNHIEQKIEYLVNQNADGVFGSIIIDDTESRKKITSRQFHVNEIMVNYLLTDGWAPTPTHFYKASCVKDIMWDETLLRHQDLDFSVRFASKYKFIPCDEVTCIVHWKKGEIRTEHFESQIRFIDKYKKMILPLVYNKYFSNFYFKVHDRNDVSLEMKKYLKKQATIYIKYSSLTDFLSIELHNDGPLMRVCARVKYCFRVLFS
jgi:glycosyltransferase involved in cell wall biosynthesis